jgi:hypothetical protein
MTQYIMEKILNVVYDTFDSEGKPIPNLINQFPDKKLADSWFLVMHYIDDTSYSPKFSQKVSTLLDVYNNPNEKYYYFINHVGELLSELHKVNSEFLTTQLIECLHKCKNFNVIFLTEHEPDNELGFILLNEYIKLKNINGKQIYIINNNSKLNDYKIQQNSDINVHTISFVPHSSTKVLHKVGGCDYETEKEGKFFMLFNKSPKVHRYALLALLKKNNLLDEINWSLVPGWNCNAYGNYYNKIFTHKEQKELEQEILYLYNLKIKVSDFEENKNWFSEFSEINNEGFPIWMHTPEYPKNYQNTYVNIITESMFLDDDNNIHISEKTFKPFFYYQIPLILTTHHHIKKVKEKYGLDFFDDIIDHSYDNEPNQRKRLDMFVNEIIRLNQNKDEVKKFYKNNKDRFEKNKQKVLNLLKIVDDDYLFFENLI